jgi:hypothetical protein
LTTMQASRLKIIPTVSPNNKPPAEAFLMDRPILLPRGPSTPFFLPGGCALNIRDYPQDIAISTHADGSPKNELAWVLGCKHSEENQRSRRDVDTNGPIPHCVVECRGKQRSP